MIIGVGIDGVDIARVRTVFMRHPVSFLTRIFTPEEQALAHAHQDPVPFLAKRFAAKEACVKALGTGFRHGVMFQDIAVLRTMQGAPCIALSGAAARVMAARMPPDHVARWHVSLSDERTFALASVVLEACAA